MAPYLVRHTLGSDKRSLKKSHLDFFFFSPRIEFDSAAGFDLGSFCSCIARRSHYGAMFRVGGATQQKWWKIYGLFYQQLVNGMRLGYQQLFSDR